MKTRPPYFQNPHLDGSPIFWPAGPKGILLLHGFTATTTEVRILAESFRELHWTVSAPLLPGHGTQPQEMNRTKYQHWMHCVDDAYLVLAKKCRIVVVAGESMGAVLCLYLSQKYSGISAILLFSPAIKIKNLRFAKYTKYFIPILEKPHNDSEDKVWQGYRVYPMKAAHEFNKLQKIVCKGLALIKQPALILHGNYDKTIDPDGSQMIFDRIRSQTKQIIHLSQSGHVMLLGPEIEDIIGITRNFLKNEVKIL